MILMTDTFVGTKTFRESYCEKFQCAPEEFARRVFWDCLPEESRPLATVLRPWLPLLKPLEHEFIEQLGDLSEAEAVASEVNEFRVRQRPGGWPGKSFQVRVSGRKLVSLASKVC